MNAEQTRVTVLGLGRMGRTYLDCLTRSGFAARGADADGAEELLSEGGDVLLLALHSGSDTRGVVTRLERGQFAYVVDLTTQRVEDSLMCTEISADKEIRYYGGGVSGGAAEMAEATGTILLGPSPIEEPVLMVIQTLGRLIEFPTAAAACLAKLLHNLVLIIQNHVLGCAMQLAERGGIKDFGRILDAGTAGRVPSRSSVVRDLHYGPSTSYTSRLVAKDLREIVATFPELSGLAGIRLEELARLYDEQPEIPYTVVAFSTLGG
jgi:3-hydroxyisobutyrate dehydrogenase-like beta-hydroxyacid dehydrogenase